MKKALILDSNSSSSEFKNGGSIRQKTIESILMQQGYEIHYFRSVELSKDISWDLIVVISLQKFRLVRKFRKKDSKIWIDLCDSWIYSRFSLTTGPRLFFIGLFEILVLLSNRKTLSDSLVTYISQLDLQMDRSLLDLLSIKQTRILRNDLHISQFRLNPSTKKRLVFLGDGNYFPNVLAVLELSLRYGPLLKKYRITEPIQVFGGNWSKWLELLPNICINRYVNEDDLYSFGDIHLAPMRQKAGIKNKIEIPRSLGLPVVAYTQSLNGITKSDNLYPCASKLDFLLSLVDLFLDGKKYSQ